ncbi:unnamed protein product [Chilo suppressalis]|uniref:Insulin-like domain-containing protein n=1 Tax=Chilo suppressalis TaxID=168631 RepID=A0ABN8B5L3_CHISP|nr:unnamed protein product [Chilo suppressalis]
MKVQLICFITILSIVSSTYGKSSAQYFCGRRLANTLAVLCSYDEVSKRSSNSIESIFETNRDIYDDQESQKDLSSGELVQWSKFIESRRVKRDASKDSVQNELSEKETLDLKRNNLGANANDDWKMQMLQGFRHKRGVVAECCDQPCKLDELLTYC